MWGVEIIQRGVEADLVANRDFRLIKATGWDSIALERITESTKEGRGAEIGAVVMGEGKFFIHSSS